MPRTKMRPSGEVEAPEAHIARGLDALAEGIGKKRFLVPFCEVSFLRTLRDKEMVSTLFIRAHSAQAHGNSGVNDRYDAFAKALTKEILALKENPQGKLFQELQKAGVRKVLLQTIRRHAHNKSKTENHEVLL